MDRPIKYTVEIILKDKHCLFCPVRNLSDDGCLFQTTELYSPKIFSSWEEQMQNCPLVEIK